MNKKKRGFSLIELLVVIAIMTLLTTIVYISVNQTRSKSRDQQRISTILKIKLGLEYYYNLNGQYPKVLWPADGTGLNSLPATSPGKITADDLIPPNNDYTHGYFYVPLTTKGTLCNSYHLYTKLESKSSVLESKAGYDSTGVPVCGSGDSNLEIDASSSPEIIYDVRPQ